MSALDAIAADLRRTGAQAMVSGAATLGTAAAFALAEAANSAFADRATTEAGTFAEKFVTAFGTDLAGRVAQTVDTNGIPVGDATISTQLVAFASGKAASPIASVSVVHDFTFGLPSVRGVGGEAVVILTAQCAFGAKDAAPKTTTTAKIVLTFTWSSAPTDGTG